MASYDYISMTEQNEGPIDFDVSTFVSIRVRLTGGACSTTGVNRYMGAKTEAAGCQTLSGEIAYSLTTGTSKNYLHVGVTIKYYRISMQRIISRQLSQRVTLQDAKAATQHLPQYIITRQNVIFSQVRGAATRGRWWLC